jgi:hypothetical protein
MSITLGIYDVFSYAIPGILYLFTFNEVLKLLGLMPFDLAQLNNAAYGILLVLLAYLVGHLFDQISHFIWYRRFYARKSEERAYARIKSLPDVRADFVPMQWPVLLSVIRHNDMELCNTIDKNKATSIMLRNVSFALFLLAIVSVISIFISGFSLISLLVVISSLIGCIVALRRGDSFNQGFYMLIYQQSLVYGTNLKEVLENNRPKMTKNEKSIRKPDKRG